MAYNSFQTERIIKHYTIKTGKGQEFFPEPLRNPQERRPGFSLFF